jgi:hypothetical protein
MNQLAENFSHLEPGMWITLWSLFLSLVLLISSALFFHKPPHMAPAQQPVPQKVREQTRIFKQDIPRMVAEEIDNSSENVTSEVLTEQITPPSPDPQTRSRPAKNHNSFGKEIYYKGLGLAVIVICAGTRYLIGVHPEVMKYSPRWQIHATLALITVVTWIFGATRKNPRGFADLLVNIVLVVWSIILFN